MWAKPDKPVNWVANRGGCTSRTALDLLERHVGCDLKEMGKLLARQDVDYTFELSRKDDLNLLVSKTRTKNGHFKGQKKGKVIEKVEFCASDQCDRISVHRSRNDGYVGDSMSFDVLLKWDFDKGVCGFSVDDADLELWQISQKALYGLFFGKGGA